jgi:hypothetical protein
MDVKSSNRYMIVLVTRLEADAVITRQDRHKIGCHKITACHKIGRHKTED